MKVEISNLIYEAARQHDTEPIWDWIGGIDFSRSRSYRAATKGRYNPNLMPWWREPVESFFDDSIREIIVVKPSQCGGSEHMILMPMRWAVANGRNVAALYASAQMERTEEFFIERLKRGMELHTDTVKHMPMARERGFVYEIADCLFSATWSKSRDGFKQRPFDWCFGDEVSSWPDVSVVDEMRKRMATKHSPKLVLISTPDVKAKRSSDDDPIFIELDETDCRKWFMPSPLGNLFTFEMGTPESVHGLKWDQSAKSDDGEWDLNRVRNSAHYICPDGSRIDNRDRIATIERGKWMPTKKASIEYKRGYCFNQFILPFIAGDFGEIAVRFLESKKKGAESLRAFVYEVLAERWVEMITTSDNDKVLQRCGGYAKGTDFTAQPDNAKVYIAKEKSKLLTIDVQKHCLYWLLREWVLGGDSGLHSWGMAQTVEEIGELADKHCKENPLIDANYEGRRLEVLSACYSLQMVPIFGSGHSMLPIVRSLIDPFEGVSGQGQNKIMRLTISPDVFKHLLFDMTQGASPNRWHIYEDIEREYLKQIQSEELKDGRWCERRGYPNNHLWDCEVYQIVAATIYGYYKNPYMVGK